LLVYLDEWNSICRTGGIRLRGGTDVLREKAVPVPLCSPQTQTDIMPGLNITGIMMLSVNRIKCVLLFTMSLIHHPAVEPVMHNKPDAVHITDMKQVLIICNMLKYFLTRYLN
jgi:hypothetical protein